MTGLSPKWQAGLLAALTMVLWSAAFSATFGYSFFWDDLHFIRHYSWEELLSTFHGPNDPDGIETMALRPIATLLFWFQGTIIGENVILQRLFMALLMGGFLWSVGALLSEIGLSIRHITVVVLLLASSRVFASLMLWITLGSLILSYIFIVLTALGYLGWVRSGKRWQLVVTIGLAALTVFTREEAYTLPVVLPLLWFISSPLRANLPRVASGAMCVAAVLAVHMIMRLLFVPEAPPIRLSASGVAGVVRTALSAWMPSGIEADGYADQLIRLLWVGFVSCVVLVFMRLSSNRALVQCLSLCALGVVLCAPALAVSRSFGVALPAIAFFSAIAIAIFEIIDRMQSLSVQPWWRPAITAVLAIGIVGGVSGGIRRSMYVAEALHENSAVTVSRNAMFLLDRYSKPATIPPRLRQNGLARLANLGIRTPADLEGLLLSIRENRAELELKRESRTALFLSKYEFLSY